MSTQVKDAPAAEYAEMINLPALNSWIETQDLPGQGEITNVSLLAGGLQNSVFLLKRGAQELILRRPGKRSGPKGSATMLREARVLQALESSAVPHPRVLARWRRHRDWNLLLPHGAAPRLRQVGTFAGALCLGRELAPCNGR
jgi:hypothetical protein